MGNGRTSVILAAVIALLAVADRVVPSPSAGGSSSGFGVAPPPSTVPPSTDRNLYNLAVASEPGRFKGWPANHGMWSWGDEMVVMYLDGPFDRSHAGGHAVDLTRDVHFEQARSVDGGLTWTVEKDPIAWPRPAAEPLKERLDFLAPGFAMHFGITDGETVSTLYYSYDRAKTWKGPFTFPTFGLASVRGRTNYLINGRRDAMAFLVGTPQGETGEHHGIVARTVDGGLTWRLAGTCTRVPPVDPVKVDLVTQPAAVRLAGGTLLSVGRSQTSGPANDAARGTYQFEATRSTDDGKTWQLVSTVGNFANGQNNDGGTPPALTRLPNGWVVLTYGYRLPPFGIRARMTKDGGTTWSDEVTLRQDGGSWDLGYTRNALRPDGRLITAYYYNTNTQLERGIQATLWNPLTAFEGF